MPPPSLYFAIQKNRSIVLLLHAPRFCSPQTGRRFGERWPRNGQYTPPAAPLVPQAIPSRPLPPSVGFPPYRWEGGGDQTREDRKKAALPPKRGNPPGFASQLALPPAMAAGGEEPGREQAGAPPPAKGPKKAGERLGILGRVEKRAAFAQKEGNSPCHRRCLCCRIIQIQVAQLENTPLVGNRERIGESEC